MHRNTLWSVAAVSAASTLAAGQEVYLVGAQLYACDEVGTNTGGIHAPWYQYSTNSSTGHVSFDIFGTPGSAIAVRLQPGENRLVFEHGYHEDPGEHAGLNLFFDSTPLSYNPPHTGVGIPGHLSAVSRTDGLPVFRTPATGVNVQSYETTNAMVSATAYSGANEYDVSGTIVRITAFAVDRWPNGSFTIEVTPPPPCYADCDTTTGRRRLDIFDFLCFQIRYFQTDPYACDCDTSAGLGICDVFDFLCFQNAFAGGCP